MVLVGRFSFGFGDYPSLRCSPRALAFNRAGWPGAHKLYFSLTFIVRAPVFLLGNADELLSFFRMLTAWHMDSPELILAQGIPNIPNPWGLVIRQIAASLEAGYGDARFSSFLEGLPHVVAEVRIICLYAYYFAASPTFS